MGRIRAPMWLFAGFVALNGCDKRDGEVRYVRVEKAHVCDVTCHEHHYDGKRVVAVKGHQHGPDCGHSWNGRAWVVARKRPARTVDHVCTIECHHHYYDRRERVVKLPASHRHGRGCGHAYQDGRWVIARAATYRK